MIYIAGWIVCGVLSYGLSYAHFVGEYPTLKTSRASHLLVSLLGPLSLLSWALTFVSVDGWRKAFKHGLKF